MMVKTTLPFLALLAALTCGCGTGAPDEAMAQPAPTQTPFDSTHLSCIPGVNDVTAKANGFPGCYLNTDFFAGQPLQNAKLCCDGSTPTFTLQGKESPLFCCP